MLYGSLINLLTKDVRLVLGVDLVLFSQILDQVEDEFLLDSVGILSDSESGRKQLIPGELHAKSLAKLDGIGDVLESFLLGYAGSEHQLGKLVVVSHHAIDWMS